MINYLQQYSGDDGSVTKNVVNDEDDNTTFQWVWSYEMRNSKSAALH